MSDNLEKGFWKSLKPLWIYITPHRRMFSVGLACAIITNSVGMLAPLIIRYAVNAVENRAGVRIVILSALALVGLKLAQGTFRFLMRRILIGLSRKIEYKIRADLFEHLETLPLSFYQHMRIGDILSRTTNDLNEVRMLLGPAIMYSFQTVVTVLIALPVMIFLDLKLALLAFLPLVLVSASYQKIGKTIHDRSIEVQRRLSDITAKVQENLAGIRVIKSFTREQSEIEQFDRMNRDYLNRNMRLVKVSGVLYPFMAFLSGLSALIILAYGGILVVRDSITLGDLTAFFIYFGMMYWPMIAVGFVLNVIQRGRASLGRIMELFNVKSDITDPVKLTSAVAGKTAVEGSISFRGLSFAYPGSAETVLRDIDIELQAGSTLAVVGPVGCGKSTLLNLVPRLFNPQPGSLLVDRVDVLEWPLARLRSAIAMVPQDTFLFSESIRDNILYGLETEALEAEIARVVEMAGLHDDVNDFPDKLDTLLGERGINLSGGQKQRTTISRALIVDAPILLLDDCFSNVDTQTEEMILRNLRAYSAERTTIIVSHRISTIKAADQIVVLEGGRITQRGKHYELIEKPGYYSSLYEKQLLREKIERYS